ncbi:hypothetical protein F2Q69_00002949 [Brassica cretica]|uniref:Uncharacterized protein n=1 Tax=Brassica cretica TaxID=69181 RepID=A0A8S9NZI0_BRACR|nr:hypothetical protein F2Q69_00002949 [Brassica cretica]
MSVRISLFSCSVHSTACHARKSAPGVQLGLSELQLGVNPRFEESINQAGADFNEWELVTYTCCKSVKNIFTNYVRKYAIFLGELLYFVDPVMKWLVVWQTGSKTANVDSVESTTPPINKPLNSLHGYPGAVSNTPTYILMSETTMEASAENKNTPINLDQNTYWNLVGNDSWNILDHMIQIWGPHITHVDQHTDHARSLRERDLLSLSPQEMDRRVYRRGGYWTVLIMRRTG